MKLNKNELYILTASFDKHKVKLYVNGVKQKECDFPWKLGWPADNTLLAVGGNPNVGSFDDCEWFRGDLYTARIYDKVLTQNEITNNYYNNKIIANVTIALKRGIKILLRINYTDFNRAQEIYSHLKETFNNYQKSECYIYYAPIWDSTKKRTINQTLAFVENIRKGYDINVLADPFLDNIVLNNVKRF